MESGTVNKFGKGRDQAVAPDSHFPSVFTVMMSLRHLMVS